MNRLVIGPRAATDLDEIADYIEIDNPAAAIRMIERLEEASSLLRQYPHIGVIRNNIAKGVCVFPVESYLILSRILDDGVEIVRYVHGARKLKGLI